MRPVLGVDSVYNWAQCQQYSVSVLSRKNAHGTSIFLSMMGVFLEHRNTSRPDVQPVACRKFYSIRSRIHFRAANVNSLRVCIRYFNQSSNRT